MTSRVDAGPRDELPRTRKRDVSSDTASSRKGERLRFTSAGTAQPVRRSAQKVGLRHEVIIMRTCKLMLALLATAVALGACVSGASANRLSLSSTTWRAVFSEPVGEPPIHVIACAATFEGSFHSAAIAKVASSLIGYITRAAIREETCRGGHLRALRETLPWHLRYEGFEGTLPIIRAIAAAAIGVAILAEFAAFPGSSCLIRTTPEEPAHIIFPRNTTTGVISFRFDETRFIRTTGICPESLLGLFGTTALTVLGTTTAITMTLI